MLTRVGEEDDSKRVVVILVVLPKVGIATKEIGSRCKSSVGLGVFHLLEGFDEFFAELIREEAFSQIVELLIVESGIR